jgi:hypothetical protein
MFITLFLQIIVKFTPQKRIEAEAKLVDGGVTQVIRVPCLASVSPELKPKHHQKKKKKLKIHKYHLPH